MMRCCNQFALIGAPTSGKSKLAQELVSKLPNDTLVVDDYVAEIEADSDLVMGKYATYIGNLYVVMGRYSKERQALASKPSHVITCGTLIESSVYATLQAVEGQTDAHWIRISNYMNILGSIYQDTWRYRKTFYLPLQKPDPNSEEAQIDISIRMAIAAFGVDAINLDGTLEEKTTTAFESIEESLSEVTPTK